MNLSCTLVQRDGFRSAEGTLLIERVTELRRKTMGMRCWETLFSISNLGQMRMQNGHFIAAAELLAEAAEGQLQLLGEDHPHTQTTLHVTK